MRAMAVSRRDDLVAGNPWIRTAAPQTDELGVADEVHSHVRVVEPEVDVAPQLGITPADVGERMSRRIVGEAERSVGVWLVGAHGGAGESTLEQLLAGSRAAGHAWPLMSDGALGLARVVVVARTHAHGLRAARLALGECASGAVSVALVGLVLIADAPGRLPRALKDLAELVGGGAPRVWRLPWMEAWRLGDAVTLEQAPREVRRFVDAVQPSSVRL